MGTCRRREACREPGAPVVPSGLRVAVGPEIVLGEGGEASQV